MDTSRLLFRGICALSLVFSGLSSAQTVDQTDRFATLRQLLHAQDRDSDGGRRAIAAELAGYVTSDSSMKAQFSDLLATEHGSWRSGATKGSDERKLVIALNHHLSLDSAAEYLQLRGYELRRIRIYVWAMVPELNGPAKKLHVGDSVVSAEMSPFEAFLASSWLIYQKMFNPEYLHTRAELLAGAGLQYYPQTTRSPSVATLSMRPLQPRELEFHSKMHQYTSKFNSTDAVVSEMRGILEESRND